MVDTVITTEISRLSRNRKDWIDLDQFFRDHGVEFISLRQKIDTSTAMGRMFFNMMIDQAQLEREIVSERVTYSSRERRRRGLYTGGPVPFGLEATERSGYLLKSEARSLIANSIVDVLLNEGGGLKQTCRIINARGWNRDCGKPWNFQALSHWINNPHIAGQVELNAKNKNKDQSKLPEGERYQLVDAVWEPVVDRSKLNEARKLLQENYARLKVPMWKEHDYLLTNLLECYHGKKLVGGSGKGRSGQKYHYYKHPSSMKCDCGIGRVPALKIEQHILRELKRFLKSPKLVEELCNEANLQATSNQPNYDDAIRTEKRRMDSITAQLDKITDEVLNSQSAEEKQMWRDKAFRLQSERNSTEKQITHFESLKNQKPEQVSHAAILSALGKLADGFKGMPVAARLRLIKGVISSIRINKDYSLTLQVKNPNLLDFNEEKESVITGAIGSPTYKNGSGGEGLLSY